MKKKVLGYFVFQQAGDGCLWAKYSNWTLRSPLTEAAKLTRIESGSNGFAGTYVSVWIDNPGFGEPDEQTDKAMLEIRPKFGTQGIYTLLWDDGERFSGEGMLFNNLLIGAYWDPELYAGSTDLFVD